jgi:hypothetical protein
MFKIGIKKITIFFFSFFLVFLSFFIFSKIDFKRAHRVLAREFKKLTIEYVPEILPRFPQRLFFLLRAGQELSGDILSLNEQLKSYLERCNCENAVSHCIKNGCVPEKVSGNPCKDLTEINQTKEEINDRIENLSLIREILRKELEGGLETELKSLNEDTAQKLRSNLNDFLEKSEDLIQKANENREIYSKDYTPKCQASCEQGPVCGIQGCVQAAVGVQKNVEIKVKVGIKFFDIDLGKVGITKFGLSLPQSIRFPKIGDLVISFPPQSLSVCFPFGAETIFLQTPAFKSLPTLSFTCPSPPRIESRQLPIPKLPRDFSIPLPSIPATKWCEIPGTSMLENLKQEFAKRTKEEIENFKKEVDGTVDKIAGAPESVVKELDKLKSDLDEYQKMVGISLATLYTTDVPSLYYQCPQNSQNQEEVKTEVKTGPDLIWYFKTLDFLMEECRNLPTMQEALEFQTEEGEKIQVKYKEYLKEKAGDCYQDDKVVETIIEECGSLWENYCNPPESETPQTPPPEPPEICKIIRRSCVDQSPNIVAIERLLRERGLSIPPEYSLNPVSFLRDECSRIKKSGEEEPPSFCEILPLLTGFIEKPSEEEYPGAEVTCPSQTLLNLPFGFGGGVGFSCPVGIPTVPKIVLPDIVIPDIILPEFSLSSFFRIKLPRIIIEDIILPDIELCDLNHCSGIFPDLRFTLPHLSLPSFDIVTSKNQKIPNLSLQTRVLLPSLYFSLPKINLFSLLLPELSLPEIKILKPKVSFGFSGLNLEGIFRLIASYILHAKSFPDLGFCLKAGIGISYPALQIIFPDYYISFQKFFGKYLEKIPSSQIPYCRTLDQFCNQMKTALGENGWINKAKEIEGEVNKTIERIQQELNKVAEATEDIKEVINEIFQEYGEIIANTIEEELGKRGQTLQDYLRTQKQRECFSVSLPPKEIIFKIDPNKKGIEKRGNQVIIYAKANIPEEIPIPWPDQLKRGFYPPLPLYYELPKIPLSDLNLQKEISIKGPGLQVSFSGSFGKNEGDCNLKPPRGGNPFPISEINTNIGEIRSYQAEVERTFQEIKKILE